MRGSVPAEAVSVYNSALEMSNQGDFSTALTEYSKAIAIFPKFLEAYNNIGEIYSKMDDGDRAITTYLQALTIERNYRVLLNLGVEYYNRGQNLPALAHFKEAVALKNDFVEGHFYAGMVYFNIKDQTNAEHHFSSVISFDRMHEKANYLLAYIYYGWKQYQAVIDCLDRIKDSTQDRSFINKYYGFCHYHLGHFDLAISFLTKAMETNPRYGEFRTYLESLTYENKIKEIGDLDARIREFEARVIEEKPSLGDYTHLSMLYIFKGDYRKAEEILHTYRLQ
jgi:tetratricopeptide (TPR) repeat protein